MKRVAILVPSLDNGGAERIAGLLSKHLSKRYHIYLFLIQPSHIVYDYEGEIVDVGPDERLEENIFREKRRLAIDVSISFLERMNFSNVRTKIGERVIVSERCAQSRFEPRHSGEDMMLRRSYPYVDAVVSLSRGVSSDLAEAYNVPVQLLHTIYNFVDQESIREKAHEPIDSDTATFLNDGTYYVALGRLEPQKNHRRMILQFEQFLKRGYPDAKLLILGTGTLRESLDVLLKSRQLEQNIRIIPFAENPFPYLAKARGMIFSSQYEGFGNVILEAMGTGTPVIATDCLSGPRELLADRWDYSTPLPPVAECPRGLLVTNSVTEDQGQTFYLADAMERLWTDDSLRQRLSLAGKQYFSSYSNDTLLNEWISIIERPERNPGNPLAYEYEQLDRAGRIVIYGAGLYGRQICRALRTRYQIESFVVTKLGEEENCMGLPVRELASLQADAEEITVVIGVSDLYIDETVQYCLDRGFKRLVFPYLGTSIPELCYPANESEAEKEM